MLDICISFPFLQSPLVPGYWFSVLEGEHGEQLLPPSLVLSIQESVAQNSSTKYPNRLTSSGQRKSQLLLLKALCIEHKTFCVSGNRMSLFKFTLYSRQQDDATYTWWSPAGEMVTRKKIKYKYELGKNKHTQALEIRQQRKSHYKLLSASYLWGIVLNAIHALSHLIFSILKDTCYCQPCFIDGKIEDQRSTVIFPRDLGL